MNDSFRKTEILQVIVFTGAAFCISFLVVKGAGTLLTLWETPLWIELIAFVALSIGQLMLGWQVYYGRRFGQIENQSISDSMEKESAYSQLKATEVQLYHSIEKYEILISKMRDIFWVADLEGNIIFINDVCSEILGYKKEEMIGNPLFRFMCPLHVYGVGNCVNIVAEMTQRDFEKEELWMLYADGHTRKVLEVNTRRIYHEGRVVEVQGVGRDVTERIRLERKIKKTNKQLMILNDITSLIAIDLLNVDRKTLFDRISKKIIQELNIPFLNIQLLAETGTLETVSASGHLKDKLTCDTLDVTNPLIQNLQQGRQPIIVDGFCLEIMKGQIESLQAGQKRYKTILIPMLSNDLTIGLVTLCVPIDFDMEMISLLNSLTHSVGLAVEKLGLYENSKTFYLKVIKTLIAAMEAKDIYTQGHSVRVAQYAVEIGKKMGLDPSDFEELEMAGLLHDIGKIGINDTILTKAGKLEKSEYDIIKEHPSIGKKILEPIGFSPRIIEAVLCHHKRYDVAGYPEQVSIETLDQFSRIIGAADAYDAMTSNRSYKNSMTADMVIQEFEKHTGTQFCPDIAHIVITLIKEDKLKK